MRRVLVVISTGTLVLATGVAAALTPARTVTEPTRVSALSVTSRTVVYAVTENATRTRCAYVSLWDTATRGLWRLGSSTTRVCLEGPSTGSGIADVSTSGRRAFWLTFVGGNTREYTLWTATPTRRSPRRLADESSDVDSGSPPIVLADGSRDGVAYAVGPVVTYVADTGARLFRTELASPVRLLATGSGPAGARVAAALENGRVVSLSAQGRVLATSQPGAALSALGLALAGPVVQRGREVTVGATTVDLPAGALVLDYRDGRLLYAHGSHVRSRRVAIGDDVLLRQIQVEPGLRPLFSTDAGSSAWASGSAVSWRGGPLP